MARKGQKLRADTVLKNYWRDNGRFADLFNAVLFQGRQEIQPGELVELDTEESMVMEHRRLAEGIQESRDVVKLRRHAAAHGVELVMLGKEAQEHIHYAMPLRVMGYDYGAYRKQYDSNARKYRGRGGSGLAADEYLSGMRKADRLVPVITVVVYYGEKPWDGATSLHGMLDIGDEVLPYVNDYRMLLVEARKSSLRLHNMDNIALFGLLEILLGPNAGWREARERAVGYAREHQVDRSVILAVAGATDCALDYDGLEREGGADMCSVWEECRAEGHKEGRKEGHEEGRAEEIVETGQEFGLSEEEIILRLQGKLGLSRQKAQEYLERFSKQAV